MLSPISHHLADAVATAAPAVVQVQGRNRPASGLVYSDTAVLTTIKALGGEDHLTVRRMDGRALDAELAGWDPATGLATLRVPTLDGVPIGMSRAEPQVGHLALAVARSWSNAVTASLGIVSVIGGPLRVGRRHTVEQVIRTTAPMHEGFAGAAFLDTAGRLLGVTTASRIRGLGVVIPAPIAWKTAATLLEHGSVKRGFLGLASQPVTLPASQGDVVGRRQGLLVVAVNENAPAGVAGVLIGDVLLSFDGVRIESPEDLLDVLTSDRVGQRVRLEMLRGSAATEVTITVGERPAR